MCVHGVVQQDISKRLATARLMGRLEVTSQVEEEVEVDLAEAEEAATPNLVKERERKKKRSRNTQKL